MMDAGEGDESVATSRVAAWLMSKKPEILAIDPDADLMKSGMLDSLQFVNFLYVIEQIRGSPIPLEQVVPKNFASLRTIAQVFFHRGT
jgi:hypothetical protein